MSGTQENLGVPPAGQPQASQPVTDAQLRSAIEDHVHQTHRVGSGPFAAVIGSFLQLILPALVQFLQQKYQILPKNPAGTP